MIREVYLGLLLNVAGVRVVRCVAKQRLRETRSLEPPGLGALDLKGEVLLKVDMIVGQVPFLRPEGLDFSHSIIIREVGSEVHFHLVGQCLAVLVSKFK
jgi:hypothetical protein